LSHNTLIISLFGCEHTFLKIPPHESFTFDLQRFANIWTLTQDGNNLKLSTGSGDDEISYTDAPGKIIATAVAGDESDNTKIKLASGDTIKLDADIKMSGKDSEDNNDSNYNMLVFNSGVSLSLDLNSYIIESTVNRAINIGNQTSESTEGNVLTIIGTGTIKGVYGIGVMGGADASKNYSTLIIGSGNGDDNITVTAPSYTVFGNGFYDGTGSSNVGANIIINEGSNIIGTSGVAVYNPQVGTLTVNGGTITSSTTAIEIRAGELNVTGGTITSTFTPTDDEQFNAIQNGNGSTTKGAGIAVAQHTTDKDISVNVSGGEISGVVALSVTNPNNRNSNSNLSIDITGGTFTGTGTDPVAAVNGDSRYDLTINGGSFKGDFRVTTATETISFSDLNDAAESDTGNIYFTIKNGSFDYENIIEYLKGTDNESKVLDGTIYIGESAKAALDTDYTHEIDDVPYYYSTEEAATADLDRKGVKASVGSKNYYTTIDKALTAAGDGGIVKLYTNVEDLDSAISIDKAVTFDLNGKNLKNASGSVFTVTTDGALTLADSGSGGTVTGLNNAVEVEAGTFNFRGGTITTDETNVTDDVAAVSVADGATFNITGGTIETEGKGLDNQGTSKINGGAVYSTGAQAIYNQNQMLKILGGLISGRIGIKILLGTLKVLGGKIRGIAATSSSEGDNVVEYYDTTGENKYGTAIYVNKSSI